MKNQIDLTYIIGVFLTFNLSLISFIFGKSSFSIIFPMVACFTYLGVIIRGKVDPDSWGKTSKKRKQSAFFGFNSIFLILFIESTVLLSDYFALARQMMFKLILLEGFILIPIYSFIYVIYFKNFRLKDD